jgi:hypothetical protein
MGDEQELRSMDNERVMIIRSEIDLDFREIKFLLLAVSTKIELEV